MKAGALMGRWAALALMRQWPALVLLATGTALAQMPGPPAGPVAPPDLRASRDVEVHVDALPDTLDLSQVQVVVQASDVNCKPGSAKFMGMTMTVPVDPHWALLCKGIDAYTPPTADGWRMWPSRQSWRERQLATHLAQLDVQLTQRYALLTHWRLLGGGRSQRWVVEEVLWDREQQQLLWHALRSIYTDDVFEKGRVWGVAINLERYYGHVLPAGVGQRGAVRRHAPVPGGRWVPVAEMAAWSANDRAALVLANAFVYPGERDMAWSRHLIVRAADQAPHVYPKGPWVRENWLQRDLLPVPALSPAMSYATHAMLEVPPGRYVIGANSGSGGERTVDLVAGQRVVLKVSRALAGADVPDLESAAWWDEWRAGRSRHAFLEDRRAPVPNVYAEAWFLQP